MKDSAHPRLAAAALRLVTFTIDELATLARVNERTAQSWLKRSGDAIVEHGTIPSASREGGRPRKLWTLTEQGHGLLAERVARHARATFLNVDDALHAARQLFPSIGAVEDELT